MENIKEEWRPIKGYEGRYEVSNLGNVKSIERMVPTGSKGGYRKIAEKILPHHTTIQGYSIVLLSTRAVAKKAFVHRLLAEAFIPNPENKTFIDHINTIRTDNRIENLRWVTAKENSNNEISKERIARATHTPEIMRKKLETWRKNGSRSAPQRVVQYTLQGEYIATYDSYMEAHRATGVRVGSISEYCRGVRPTAGGYVWRHEGQELGEIIIPRHPSEKRVVQIEKSTGKVVREFNSIAEAASARGVRHSSMSRAIHRGTFRGQYIWKLKE